MNRSALTGEITPPMLTEDKDANDSLIDNPLALVIGMLLDQQIPMERAFGAPYLLQKRLEGTLSVATIVEMPPDLLISRFSEKPALHRFPKAMAERTVALCRVIEENYSGEASQVWDECDDGVLLLTRLEALPGFGKQKAKIFMALLAKRFGVKPTGWRDVTHPFGEADTYMSVADIDSKEAFTKVRAFKAETKASAAVTKRS